MCVCAFEFFDTPCDMGEVRASDHYWYNDNNAENMVQLQAVKYFHVFPYICIFYIHMYDAVKINFRM